MLNIGGMGHPFEGFLNILKFKDFYDIKTNFPLVTFPKRMGTHLFFEEYKPTVLM